MKLVLDLEKSIPPDGYEFDGVEARNIKRGESYTNSNLIASSWYGPNPTTGKYFPLRPVKWEPKTGDEVWVINATVYGGWVVLSCIYGSDIDRGLKIFKTKEAALAALDQLNNAPTGG